jgi:hypothetical protein
MEPGSIALARYTTGLDCMFIYRPYTYERFSQAASRRRSLHIIEELIFWLLKAPPSERTPYSN